jgi:hypothetical protein
MPTKPLIKNASTTSLTLPAIGAAAFPASGPYSGFVLLTTIPADEGRQRVQVGNMSTSLVVLVLDDGTTASGSVPAAGKASAVSLAAASTAGGPGGVYQDKFQGRVQVYAASAAAQVAAFAR